MTVMFEDTDFNPNAEQERIDAAERAERMREVRREILRVQRGEADEDIRADEEAAEAEAERQAEAERKIERRHSNWFYILFSGIFLAKEIFRESYGYLGAIAVMFFISIIVMFSMLNVDMKYNRLDREVELLRERVVRMQEQVYGETTHSAVQQHLRERGIELYDPLQPLVKIDE